MTIGLELIKENSIMQYKSTPCNGFPVGFPRVYLRLKILNGVGFAKYFISRNHLKNSRNFPKLVIKFGICRIFRLYYVLNIHIIYYMVCTTCVFMTYNQLINSYDQLMVYTMCLIITKYIILKVLCVFPCHTFSCN